MKKLFLTLVLSLSFLVAPTKKAEAAIVVTAIGAFAAITASETMVPVLMVGGPIYAGIGYWIFKTSDTIGWQKFGKILLILDAEGNLPEEKLEEALGITYPFINNQNVIHDLAFAVKEKYELNKSVTMVSLEKNKTKEILATTDLSEDEIQLVTNGLK